MILRRMREAWQALTGNSSFDRWFASAAQSTVAGVSVTEETALNYSAVYAAVRLLAGTVGSMPVHVFKRHKDGTRERDQGHPVERLLNDDCNACMDGLTFREVLQANTLKQGNGYAEIERSGTTLVALHPIASEWVDPVFDNKTRNVVYRVRRDGKAPTPLPADVIFHVKNIGKDGITGDGVITRARESMGIAIAAERHAGAFFGNGARPGGVLTFPNALTDAAHDRLLKEWQALHGGPHNAHKTAILEEGGMWKETGIPPEDAQLLETRKFSVTEIARWFGVPPHLLGDLERATFSNIENQSLEFLQFGLRYWLKKWESAINRQLFTEKERRAGLFAEFITADLVKADITSRYGAYNTGRNGGWLSVNDIRRFENMNPIGIQGDIYLVPANMTAAGQIQQGTSE